MILWAPFDKRNIDDPYGMYARLRREQPIYKAQTGEWIITKYEDVKNLLKDNRFKAGNKKEWLEKGIAYFDQKDQDLRAIAKAIDTFVLLLNPPEHTAIRKLIMKAWDDRAVEDIITSNVNYLIKRLEGKKQFDLIEDFSSNLPVLTIADIMGIPKEDYIHLRDAGRLLIKAVNPYITFKDLVEMNTSAQTFIDYFKSHLRQQTTTDGNDLISKMIKLNKAQLPDEQLHENQLISICIFLFIAGEETTISFVGSAIMNLAKFPKQLERLQEDGDLLDSAMEELLRYDGPVHLLGRVVGEDLNYKGFDMKAGEVVTLCLASANRDEEQFANADQLLLDRSPNRHIAFGSGIHFCLGDWLAKKQARVALHSFLKAFPNYRVDHESITRTKNLSIRALDSLIIYT